MSRHKNTGKIHNLLIANKCLESLDIWEKQQRMKTELTQKSRAD